MKATKIGELRRLSAEENLKIVEGILNQGTHPVDRFWKTKVPWSELTEKEADTRRAEIKEVITYPTDYKITWTAKVSKSLQSAEGYGFQFSQMFQENRFLHEALRGTNMEITGALGGNGFTYELEKASQQQPILMTIGEESLWLYQALVYRAPLDLDPEEILLLIKEQELQKTKKLEKLRRLVEVSETLEKASHRERIPEEVQMFVWRRDGAKCVKCESQENLEFDHVIPVSKGGANTARNIQLLCEACNRAKSDRI